MPGLAGIISPLPKHQNADRLNQMLQAMHQESFYSFGTYFSEAAGLHVGWRCYKGSSSDCLPIRDERNALVMFFYGENFSEIKFLKEKNDHSILEMFRKNRYGALKLFNGWFYGLILDLKQNEVLMFNDRYGMQRLYYYQDGDSFLFASEAKAILAVKRELRTLDPIGVGEFLTCDSVLENRTLFSGLLTLPGGAAWTFKNARLYKKEQYFQPEEWERQPILEQEEFSQNLENVFERVMPRYLRPGLPIGISLTGGLDTRTIMASIDHGRHKFPCYTFGGMHRESFDVKIAREVAFVCGQKHQVLSLRDDFLSSFSDLAEKTVYISDGCLNACEAYELYLNRLAREVADVRLTGNYGSEVLRSMRAFKAVLPNRKSVHPDFWHYISTAMERFERVSHCHDLTFTAFKQAPWHGYGRLSIEQSQLIPRTPFMDNELVGLMYQAPQSARKSSHTTTHLIERRTPQLAQIRTDRALHRGSRNLSATINYVLSRALFKADYYCKSGMPQWLEQLHYFIRPLQLERLVLGRHRFTFSRGWLRNELAAYVKHILLDPLTASRSHVNPPYIETIVCRHIKGDRNYTNEIEKLITLELIYRLFIDQ